jgi:hypothetical protein
MQGVGLIGESWLLSQIPMQFALLRNSIFRFISFDAAGLLFLLIALGIMISLRKYNHSVPQSH